MRVASRRVVAEEQVGIAIVVELDEDRTTAPPPDVLHVPSVGVVRPGPRRTLDPQFVPFACRPLASALQADEVVEVVEAVEVDVRPGATMAIPTSVDGVVQRE